ADQTWGRAPKFIPSLSATTSENTTTRAEVLAVDSRGAVNRWGPGSSLARGADPGSYGKPPTHGLTETLVTKVGGAWRWIGCSSNNLRRAAGRGRLSLILGASAVVRVSASCLRQAGADWVKTLCFARERLPSG